MAEDKAHDRVESGDSGRECNAVIRPQGPDAARMDFFNGLIGEQPHLVSDRSPQPSFGRKRPDIIGRPVYPFRKVFVRFYRG